MPHTNDQSLRISIDYWYEGAEAMNLRFVTRRAVLNGMMQSVVAGAMVTRACANPATSPETSLAQTSLRRTSLNIAMSLEPPALDPTASAPVSVGKVTWSNIFEGLVTIDRYGKIQPQLATEWTISPDGLIYTFQLRKGVVFHNGTPLTASVAKFSLDRARAPDSENPQKHFFAQIDWVEARGPLTLIIHMKRRNSSLLYWLGWPASVIIAPDSAQTNAVRPIGTGPFRFSNWSKGKTIDLVVNEQYWNRSEIALKAVTFHFIDDPDVLASGIKSGTIDAVPEFNSPDPVAQLQRDTSLKVAIGVTEMKVIAGLNNARKPFNDLRVRQALMMAVDRSAIIDGGWDGLGTEIGSHYTPNDRAYRDLTGIYPYDPVKSKGLLASAGYPNGFSFTAKIPQMPYAVQCAQILQASFAEVGVTMKIKTALFPEVWTREVFDNADYDMTIMAHAEPMDIGIFAQQKNYFNYHNPAFNAVLDAIERTTDAKEQDGLYGEAQTMLAKDLPALFLFALPKIGVWNAKLQGMWENEPMPSIALSHVRFDD
ncbi:peptide/nickel transport system substrate-binding protein [Agrobacterium vitis]|nr:peptide/nickel transport system substrate-binding protein [Agrobacterium vitis]